MNIKRAKEEIEHTVKAYLAKDALGEYAIPAIRQRPILLMGPPGIGKTQVMEQVARECGVALVAYTITHHTRQSAVGLPFIRQRHYGNKDVSVTEYTMSEIIASIYAKMESTGLSEGILFIDEINCVSETLAHVYNAKLPAKRQGEVYHRYVMGVYELQRRLTEKYPHLLLENCAGGGARFDCGMLYYSPQIWCSDNTDARSRLVIQYGTSLFYPGCVMGAHFSTVPNHCTGHISTVEARMAAALTGTFGFELDLTQYTEEELAQLRSFVAWYHTHGALLRGGELHRLVNPEPNGLGSAWMLSAKDGSEATVFAVGDALTGSHGTASPNARPRLVLAGLDPAAQYRDEENNTYAGAQLLTTGLELPGGYGQMPAKIWYLKKV